MTLAKTRATHRQLGIGSVSKKQNKTKQNKTKISIRGPTWTFPPTCKKKACRKLQINKLHNYQKIFIFHFVWHGGSFWYKFKACARWLKKQKQTNKKQKQKARSTDLWLNEFSSPQWPPLSKWLRLKWQVAQSFHQACSHDLFCMFWEGVGPPKVDLLN